MINIKIQSHLKKCFFFVSSFNSFLDKQFSFFIFSFNRKKINNNYKQQPEWSSTGHSQRVVHCGSIVARYSIPTPTKAPVWFSQFNRLQLVPNRRRRKRRKNKTHFRELYFCSTLTPVRRRFVRLSRSRQVTLRFCWPSLSLAGLVELYARYQVDVVGS